MLNLLPSSVGKNHMQICMVHVKRKRLSAHLANPQMFRGYAIPVHGFFYPWSMGLGAYLSLESECKQGLEQGCCQATLYECPNYLLWVYNSGLICIGTSLFWTKCAASWMRWGMVGSAYISPGNPVLAGHQHFEDVHNSVDSILYWRFEDQLQACLFERCVSTSPFPSSACFAVALALQLHWKHPPVVCRFCNP